MLEIRMLRQIAEEVVDSLDGQLMIRGIVVGWLGRCNRHGSCHRQRNIQCDYRRHFRIIEHTSTALSNNLTTAHTLNDTIGAPKMSTNSQRRAVEYCWPEFHGKYVYKCDEADWIGSGITLAHTRTRTRTHTLRRLS